MRQGEADMRTQENRLMMKFLIATLVLLGWFVLVRPAQAVEFGDTTVSSFIGQPLVAEVELTALTPEESAALQVKQAGRDVYRGANIQFNPVLSGLRWVVQHRDKRQFLRLSTEKPINATYLNMFFELGLKTDYAVRALTVWIEPNPNPNVAVVDSVEPRDDAEEGQSQPEIAELPQALQARGAMVGGLLDYKRNNEGKNGNNVNSLSSAPKSCSQSNQRCIAIERENRIIAANITELEKSVRVLQKAMIPESQVLNSEKSEQALPGGESGAPADLFLKQEEPLLPKPVVVKPSFWKALPWKTIALAGAALAVVGALGYLMLVKWRKKASVKPQAKSANKPSNKPSNKSSNKPVKNSVWRKWREMLVDKWRKKFGRKPQVTIDESDGQVVIIADKVADEADREAAHEADSAPEKAGKKSRWSFRSLSFMPLLKPLQEFWAKLRKKTAASATPKVKSGT